MIGRTLSHYKVLEEGLETRLPRLSTNVGGLQPLAFRSMRRRYPTQDGALSREADVVR
jgi:hypothetical protein